MIKEKIIEHHGRIENIVLYDSEPTKEDLENLLKAKTMKPEPVEVAEEDFQGKANSSKTAKLMTQETSKNSVKQFENDSAYLWEIFNIQSAPNFYGFAKKKESIEK